MLVPNRLFSRPVDQLTSYLSPASQATLAGLIGSMSVPNEQPNAVRVVHGVCLSISSYAATLQRLRPTFLTWLDDVKKLGEEIGNLLHLDATPFSQFAGRRALHHCWQLQLLLDGPGPVSIAAGAELVHAHLYSSTVAEGYFQQLHRDLAKVSLPSADEPLDEHDLSVLRFGLKWQPHFNRIDAKIRQIVELPDPDGPQRYLGEFRAALKAQAEIRKKILYPVAQHRACAVDHRHIPLSQLSAVMASLKDRVYVGCPNSICVSLEILTSAPADLVMNLPLQTEGFWVAAADLSQGVLVLNLDTIFPFRRRPSAASAALFLEASPILATPIPDFILDALRQLHQKNPDALCIGDLLDWPVANQRQNLLTHLPSRIPPTVARARASLAVQAVRQGVPRSVVAFGAWDFGMMPAARAYYLRLPASALAVTWSDFLEGLGWSIAPETRSRITPVGAMACLRDDSVVDLFQRLANDVEKSRPGRNAGLETLVRFHNAYAIYICTLVVFCCGLRPRVPYSMNARDWHPARPFALVNDKDTPAQRGPRPVALSQFIRDVLALWFTHCMALKMRLDTLGRKACPDLKHVVRHLQDIEDHKPVPLFFTFDAGKVCALGSTQLWANSDPSQCIPANAGRSFWTTKLFELGLDSATMDVFTRHITRGLEADSETGSESLGVKLARLDTSQSEVMADLLPVLAHGLRRFK